MALYSVWFTGLKTRAKLKKEKEKVRFCAQSFPFFLQCFLFLYFICFKVFYPVNPMYIKRNLGFSTSAALCLHTDQLKDGAECSHPTAWVLPGRCLCMRVNGKRFSPKSSLALMVSGICRDGSLNVLCSHVHLLSPTPVAIIHSTIDC